IAKSIIDYIFRWLGSRFLEATDKAALGLIDRSHVVADAPPAFGAAAPQADGAAPNTLGGSTSPTTGGSTESLPNADEPKAALAVEAPPRAEPTAEQLMPKADKETGVADAARVTSSSPAPTSELAVIANGNGHNKAANGKTNGSTITLSLGTTNVAFKIQEDAPSCAECGSIMIRNGSCYKCLNCGSTSGCS